MQERTGARLWADSFRARRHAAGVRRRAWLPALLTLSLLAGCGDEGNGEWPESRLGDYDGSALSELLPPREGANIIVISFDAMRADVLAPYGAPAENTPNIERFARSAVVFDNAQNAAQATPTSFAAAFSGQWPNRVFRGWQFKAPVTLAQIFSKHDYTTAGFMHNLQVMEKRGFGKGFDHYEVWRNAEDKETLQGAIDWLKRHKEERVFAWVHFMTPHGPYDYREMAERFYSDDYEGRFERTAEGKFEARNAAELERLWELYRGEVYYADYLFGRMLETLEEAGYLDNSIVVLTSDHGEQFQEHGGMRHNRVYEEVIAVPLIVSHPDLNEPQRTAIPYSNTDLLPTLTALAGIDAPIKLDGRDLTEGVARDRVRLSLAMTSAKHRSVAVRRGDFKLIINCVPEYSEELYDLDADPGEQNDLIREHPDIAGALYEAAEASLQQPPCEAMTRALRGKSITEGLDNETVERLKSLGYVQ